MPAMAHEANSSQAEQEKDKDSKDKKKTMTKTESGLKYLDDQGRHRRAAQGRPHLRRALHRLALGK